MSEKLCDDHGYYYSEDINLHVANYCPYCEVFRLTAQLSALQAENEQLKTKLSGRTYYHDNAAVEAENERLKEDLDFAFKRAMVLIKMFNIDVHESPSCTGTILGIVRRKAGGLQSNIRELEIKVVDRGNSFERVSIDNARLRKALEEIALPCDHEWYKSADDGDDVVDSMIKLAREALKEAGE